MAYDPLLPADESFVANGPGEIRTNQEALKDGQIVDAGKLSGLTAGHNEGNLPVSDRQVNLGLNADMVDGNHSSAFAANVHNHAVATIDTAGFMSATDKVKLNGVEAGAEVNQNAFAKVAVGSTTVVADAKQDTLTLAAGNGIALTPDSTNDKVTIAVNGSYNAPTADKLKTPRTINGVAFDGSQNITVNPPSHAVNASTYGLASASVYGHAMASSTTPKPPAATANVGSETSKFARGDHSHALQTTISGNAGSATKLQTARTINGVAFDGTKNITIPATDNTKAPKPQTAAGVGQWVFITTSNSFALPSGGTWAYYWKGNNSGGAGIAAGGTTVSSQGDSPRAFAWRIA